MGTCRFYHCVLGRKRTGSFKLLIHPLVPSREEGVTESVWPCWGLLGEAERQEGRLPSPEFRSNLVGAPERDFLNHFCV